LSEARASEGRGHERSHLDAGAPRHLVSRHGRARDRGGVRHTDVTGDGDPTATRLVAGLASGSGSTVGPDGALYVTEGAVGRVSRVDPQTGGVTTYASGLPPSIVGIGGAMDVEFIDGTAYVLVTLVGSDVGGHDGRWHLPCGRAGPLHRHRGHRRMVGGPSARDALRHPNRGPVRHGEVPQRLPGDRRPPQSGVAGEPRWDDPPR
jgi:hypothetical protein